MRTAALVSSSIIIAGAFLVLAAAISLSPLAIAFGMLVIANLAAVAIVMTGAPASPIRSATSA